ncbi:MAG: Ppx/GppA phosphatase family protein [Chloroflexota bacterium]|nr:Ppx/GppA phosphatase family protein [Chloroflexota bacterium]MDE2958874.1 Ppx/GppA phosphatase family protein [Chloroflexota bacterium]
MTTIQTTNPALASEPSGASLEPVANYAQGHEGSNPFPQYTAVIDIGSGSARAVVMQVNQGGGIEIVAQQRVTLNLMSHVRSDGYLDETGVASTLDALEDFALVARAYGIETIHAVGTAALRESGNAETIRGAARKKFGIPLRIIDGSDEAAYCFVGAIHGLRAKSGLLADIGGGSTEIVRFRDRDLASSVSLPLGSLRIANQFDLRDRPAAESVQAAYDYVRTVLTNAGVEPIPDDGTLVGSGGSVRLLSRLDRLREPYPIIKLHGYEIRASALVEQIEQLSAMSRVDRASIPGMNPERSHSIIGGGVVAHALMQHLGTDRLLVSGQGLREGLARHPDPPSACESVQLPPLATVRSESLADLVGRFAPRFGQRGERRAELAARIADAVWRGGNRQIANSLRCAARLLDIGNAVDYYNRLNRTASIIVRTDLPGFTHVESAQIAAILLAAEFETLPRGFQQSRLLCPAEQRLIQQAAVILETADELDGRLPQGTTANTVTICQGEGNWRITTPGWSTVAAPGLPAKWKKAFAEHVLIERGAP